MRIDKFLSQLKYCTRSNSQSFLKTHSVYANETQLMSPRDIIDPVKEKITIDGHHVYYKEHVHLMMYKPEGYLSANHDQKHPCVVDLLKDPYHRFDFSIAGRLDLDASGLLILTTEGAFVHDIISPKKHVHKVYEVMLDKPFNHEHNLYEGVSILDGHHETYLAKAIAIETDQERVFITIDEGKFHQVKRMFQALDYKVLSLKRIRIGSLKLGDLKPGEYIEIQKEDVYD